MSRPAKLVLVEVLRVLVARLAPCIALLGAFALELRDLALDLRPFGGEQLLGAGGLHADTVQQARDIALDFVKRFA